MISTRTTVRTVAASAAVVALVLTMLTGVASARTARLPEPPPASDFKNSSAMFTLDVSNAVVQADDGCETDLVFTHGVHKRVPSYTWEANGGTISGIWALTSRRTVLWMGGFFPAGVEGSATWNGSAYVGTLTLFGGGYLYFADFSVSLGSHC